jgi:hypothetical protein
MPGRPMARSATRALVPLLLALVALLAVPAVGHAATTVVNDDDPNVTYTGSWATCVDAQYYDGDCHFSNDIGDTVTFVFTGSFIRVIGGTNANNGQMDAQICAADGTACGPATVMDQASKLLQKQQVVYANYGLSSGSHMLKLTLRSQTTGTGRYIHIDAFAFGTPITGTRYVSNSGCSNGNAGTSTGAPWCDFTNLNGETFAPGAEIRLARGSSWNQQLGKLYGAGTSGSPISIDAYGSGAKPLISRSRNASDRGIWLDNPDWWTLRNLEVANTGAGIVAYFTTNGHEGLRFENITTRDNDVIHNSSPGSWTAQPDLPGMYHGAAIFITGNVPVTASTRAITNIVSTGHESDHDSNPMDIAGFNPPGGSGLNGFLHDDLGHHAAGDITIRNAYFHDAKGAPNFDNIEDLHILSTRIERMCTAHQSIGTTSLFLWSTDDVTVENSVIGLIPDTDSVDGTAVDLEAYNSDATFRGNWFGLNQGAAIEFLGLVASGNRPGDYSTGHVVSGNVFEQNGLAGGAQEASLHFFNSSGISMTGTASGNLYYEPGGLVTAGSGTHSWSISNNKPVSSAGAFHAGEGFGSTQGAGGWGYQTFNGTSYSNLSFDSTNGWWGTSAGYVSRFDQLPTASSTAYVARTWTAPKAGTVSLRGRVFKNDTTGDGVRARITHNGTKIWPTAGSTQSISAADRTGVATDVDNISVAAGDVIRFEVNAGASGANGGDLTSWAPGIGYTALASPGVTVVQDTATGTGVNQVNYASGTWNVAGSVHYNSGSSGTAYYLVKFTGTRVVVHGGRNSDRGIGRFRICDENGANCGAATSVDMYNSSLLTDQINWTSPILPHGTYTLRVETTGTKNASSSGYIVDLDYVTVSADSFVINNDVTGTGENQVDYASGTWTRAGNVHYNTGTSTTATAFIEFTGTQAVVHGGRNSDRGLVAYSICDANGANCGAETIVDAYSPTLQGNQALWTSPVLAPGSHTVKIRSTNTKNASSSGYIVDFDKLMVN